MDAREIMESEDFRKCVDFHGHICPGLSIGYKAAKVALEKLNEQRSEDEEIVAVVETDACSADAVQVLTGCTFGKGNLIYKDYGKMALTLLSRKTGEGIRVVLRPGAFSPDEEHLALIRKMVSGEADEDEKKKFQEIHFRRSCDVLTTPEDRLFVMKPVKTELPAKAKIDCSRPCSVCGEPTMAAKLLSDGDRKVCRECLEKTHSAV